MESEEWDDDDPCEDIEDAEDDDDFDEDECRQKRLDTLIIAAQALLSGIVLGYLRGNQTDQVTALGFMQMLGEAHARAAMLGRQKAGDNRGLTVEDRHLGARIAEGEGKFFDRFMEDLQKGRYEGDEAAAARRAHMYTNLLRGTANRGFVLASGPETMFRWVLGPNENHCEGLIDCPSISIGGANNDGVYPAAELPTMPGEGLTPCMGNCECALIRADGVSGFARNRQE